MPKHIVPFTQEPALGSQLILCFPGPEQLHGSKANSGLRSSPHALPPFCTTWWFQCVLPKPTYTQLARPDPPPRVKGEVSSSLVALLQEVAPPSQLPLLTGLGPRVDHASSAPAQWEPNWSRSCPLPPSCPGTGRPPLSRAPLTRTLRPQAPALAGRGAGDRIFQKQSPAPKKASVHKVASAGDLATSVLPRPSGESGELRATAPLLGLPSQAWLSTRTVFFLSHFQDPPFAETLTTVIGRLPPAPCMAAANGPPPTQLPGPQGSYRGWCTEQMAMALGAVTAPLLNGDIEAGSQETCREQGQNP